MEKNLLDPTVFYAELRRRMAEAGRPWDEISPYYNLASDPIWRELQGEQLRLAANTWRPRIVVDEPRPNHGTVGSWLAQAVRGWF